MTFYQNRSLKQILLEGVHCYWTHGWVLTKPLILPLVGQLVGIVLWLSLTYCSIEWLSHITPKVHPVLLWTIFIAANFPGLYLFVTGFWQYLIWVCGVNLLVRDLYQLSSANTMVAHMRLENRATDYSLLWAFLFALVFIPFVVALVPLLVVPTQSDWFVPACFLAIGLFVVGYIMLVVALVYFSLAFQVFAFTPASAMLTMLRSVDLVQQGFWKTLAVMAVTLMATQGLFPFLGIKLLGFLGVTGLFSHGFEAIVLTVIQQSYGSVSDFEATYPELVRIGQGISQIQGGMLNPFIVSYYVVETILYSLISAFLLPLGAIWCCLLYVDLKKRLDERLQQQQQDTLLPLEKEHVGSH